MFWCVLEGVAARKVSAACLLIFLPGPSPNTQHQSYSQEFKARAMPLFLTLGHASTRSTQCKKTGGSAIGVCETCNGDDPEAGCTACPVVAPFCEIRLGGSSSERRSCPVELRGDRGPGSPHPSALTGRTHLPHTLYRLQKLLPHLQWNVRIVRFERQSLCRRDRHAHRVSAGI